jgi:hypothetical protein
MRPYPLVLALVLVVVSPLLTGPPARAQSNERCFSETGYCISGRIREFWEQNGGLPVFGLPITPQQQETIQGQTLQVQWFERNRLELHPENARPYDVLLGRLGADRLAQQNRDPFAVFPREAEQPGCHYFAETAHNVCGDILGAWRANGLDLGAPGVSEGESLALFGLPLSGLTTETLTDGRQYQVQWFERARFELHPENPPPFNVLLGLLGSEVRAGAQGQPQQPVAPAPAPAPAPEPQPQPVPSPGGQNEGKEDVKNCPTPSSTSAPNSPVAIIGLDKQGAEAVTIKNVTAATVDVTGWRICSVKGNQLHAILDGTFGAGQTATIPSQAQGSIWNNSSRDDAVLYDAGGSQIAYWIDR